MPAKFLVIYCVWLFGCSGSSFQGKKNPNQKPELDPGPKISQDGATENVQPSPTPTSVVENGQTNAPVPSPPISNKIPIPDSNPAKKPIADLHLLCQELRKTRILGLATQTLQAMLNQELCVNGRAKAEFFGLAQNANAVGSPITFYTLAEVNGAFNSPYQLRQAFGAQIRRDAPEIYNRGAKNLTTIGAFKAMANSMSGPDAVVTMAGPPISQDGPLHDEGAIARIVGTLDPNNRFSTQDSDYRFDLYSVQPDLSYMVTLSQPASRRGLAAYEMQLFILQMQKTSAVVGVMEIRMDSPGRLSNTPALARRALHGGLTGILSVLMVN